MNLSRSISKYAAITRINLLNNLAYIGELMYRSIFMVLILYVFVQLWRVAYGGGGGGGVARPSLSRPPLGLVMTRTILLCKNCICRERPEKGKEGAPAPTRGCPVS